MKIKLILIGLFVSSLAIGQKCNKYTDRNARDLFTGDTILASREIIYSQPTIEVSRTISFQVQDNNRVFLHLSSGRSQDLLFGSEVELTFENDEQLILRIEQMNRVKEGTVMITHANCRIYYQADVERFYQTHLKSIKLDGSRLEFSFDKGEKTKILAGMLCLVENIGIGNLNFSSERKTKLVPDGSFAAISGSFVTVSGSVKCDFELDTLIDGKEVIKLSKPREISSSPNKLMAQIRKQGEKFTLYLTYNSDLGNINANAYALFKFSDGTSHKFKHIGEYSNEEKPVFEIDITLYRDMFMSKDLEGIRLSYSEYYADLIVSNKRYLADFLRYCF